MKTTNQKPNAGQPLPAFSATRLDGSTMRFEGSAGNWFLLIVYRGKHCGRCKKYLNSLESMQSDWRKSEFGILVVSADSVEKANSDAKEHGWTFDISCELGESDMERLGLYISDPLTPEETDRRFAEPAVFCIRPDNTVQIAAISNGPSARPDLAELLDGMKFTIEHNKPARGMVIQSS